jgi:hypothetical protein
VPVNLRAKQPSRGTQRLDDVVVGLLDEPTGEVGDPLVEGAVGPHRVLKRYPVLLAEAEVVLAEGDRGVHDAGAFVGGDEVGVEDGVALWPVVGDVGERGLVADADQR